MARILAIASGGGHWEQLQLISPAFAGHEVRFVTTLAGLGHRAGQGDTRVVTDCNADQPLRALRCLWDLVRVFAAWRPDAVVSTGALPGFLALALGRLTGARTVWVDSVANAEQLSSAGRHALRIAHVHFSQWPHVAQIAGTRYAGNVL